jgi:hypothetical protein
MSDLWKKLGSLMGKDKQQDPKRSSSTSLSNGGANRWDRVYEERSKFYSEQIGTLPEDILRIGHMLGVWPGGGLYVIPAHKIERGAWAFTTFGFTNVDMPTNAQLSNISVQHDNSGRFEQASGTLKAKSKADVAPGFAGYGYELMVLTRENAEWPLWILQWAAEAEILNDAGILGRVEKYDGLTIEGVRVAQDKSVDLLIAKASEPLPSGTELSSGKMELLIATVITNDEMKWSMEHGCEALLDRLIAKGIGQFSVLDRPSIFSAPANEPIASSVARCPIDFSAITSFEKAEELSLQGRLEKIFLFPLEFGGEDIRPNIAFVPMEARRAKADADDKVVALVEEGKVSQYSASPEYKGESFVPARILISASDQAGASVFSSTITIW